MKSFGLNFKGPVTDVVVDISEPVVAAVPGSGGGGPPEGKGNGGGQGGGSGGNNGNGSHGNGNGNPNPGIPKGELFGDQIVVLRDLDGGGDDGAPLLNAVPGYDDQMVVVGFDFDGSRYASLVADLDVNDPDYAVKLAELDAFFADNLFPIYFEQDLEGDWEIPADLLDYVQEVELERANVARAPSKVMEKSLLAALDKVNSAYEAYTDDIGASLDDYLKTDPAGRIMYRVDTETPFLTIDAPLENLALYQMLMSQEGTGITGWSQELVDSWQVPFQEMVGDDVGAPDWDPSALIGAAWSKEGEITLDALVYENTTLGVNTVTGSGDNLTIDYFDFSEGDTETYNYIRSARYENVDITWWQEVQIDPDTVIKVQVTDNVFNAVFDGDEWGYNDGDDELLANEDVYLALNATQDDFVFMDASSSGLNDFAQAADDARAVIAFIHEYDGELA